ncbi:MAG: hypothetical protein OXC42_01000 [Gammaproteobacteria bacterium]|nr:hypothetical protein [Gammaproteobacteria bacterium]
MTDSDKVKLAGELHLALQNAKKDLANYEDRRQQYIDDLKIILNALEKSYNVHRARGDNRIGFFVGPDKPARNEDYKGICEYPEESAVLDTLEKINELSVFCIEKKTELDNIS